MGCLDPAKTGCRWPKRSVNVWEERSVACVTPNINFRKTNEKKKLEFHWMQAEHLFCF